MENFLHFLSGQKEQKLENGGGVTDHSKNLTWVLSLPTLSKQKGFCLDLGFIPIGPKEQLIL